MNTIWLDGKHIAYMDGTFFAVEVRNHTNHKRYVRRATTSILGSAVWYYRGINCDDNHRKRIVRLDTNEVLCQSW